MNIDKFLYDTDYVDEKSFSFKVRENDNHNPICIQVTVRGNKKFIWYVGVPASISGKQYEIDYAEYKFILSVFANIISKDIKYVQEKFAYE